MTTAGLSYWQPDTTDEPLLNVTIGDLLDQRAEELPTLEAIVYYRYPEISKDLDLRWTYNEHCELALRSWRSRSRPACLGVLATIALHRIGGSRCFPDQCRGMSGAPVFGCADRYRDDVVYLWNDRLPQRCSANSLQYS